MTLVKSKNLKNGRFIYYFGELLTSEKTKSVDQNDKYCKYLKCALNRIFTFTRVLPLNQKTRPQLTHNHDNAHLAFLLEFFSWLNFELRAKSICSDSSSRKMPKTINILIVTVMLKNIVTVDTFWGHWVGVPTCSNTVCTSRDSSVASEIKLMLMKKEKQNKTRFKSWLTYTAPVNGRKVLLSLFVMENNSLLKNKNLVQEKVSLKIFLASKPVWLIWLVILIRVHYFPTDLSI